MIVAAVANAEPAIRSNEPAAYQAGAGGTLAHVSAGMPVLYGGNRVTTISPEIAAAFRPGDRLIVLQTDGTVLRVPAATYEVVAAAVRRAGEAFASPGGVSDA